MPKGLGLRTTGTLEVMNPVPIMKAVEGFPRLRTVQILALLVLLIIAVLASGCGSGAGDSAHDTPARATKAKPAANTQAPRQQDEKCNAVDVRTADTTPGPTERTLWETKRISRNGRCITVEGMAGVDDCHGFNRATVRESASRVVITVLVNLPKSSFCSDVGGGFSATVALSRALGMRKIVDGAQPHSAIPVFDTYAFFDSMVTRKQAGAIIRDLREQNPWIVEARYFPPMKRPPNASDYFEPFIGVNTTVEHRDDATESLRYTGPRILETGDQSTR